MRIAIVHNQSGVSLELAKQLEERIAHSSLCLNNENPEVVVTIGGDGTLLSAFHHYSSLLHQIRFVGVHTGHLGFYTDWRDYELEALVESLINGEGESISYPLLDVRVRYRNQNEEQHFLALNESTVKSLNHTMVADVCIKDEYFERFRGDGISIATPTGSTAYNKSVGGAVIHPRINALQLTEIASLNNRVYRTLGSPIIIPSDEWIKIKLQSEEEYVITVDQLSLQTADLEAIFFKIADERIHFASFRHTHFWRRVKDAFISEN